MKRQSLPVFICILLILYGYVRADDAGFSASASGARHFLHMVNPPEDLYKPIVLDAIPLWEVGFSKSYSLAPKYMDLYMISLLAKNQDISTKEKILGRLKVEFIWQGKTISEYEVTSIKGGWGADNDKEMKYYKEIFILRFWMPLQEKYSDDVSIRLTVLEGFQNLKKYGDSLQLQIAVDASDSL